MTTKWIDISVAVHDNMVHWPGDSSVKIERTSSIDSNDEANVTAISMSAHTGTHVDAPLHFINNGADVSEISLEKLTGKTKVFEILNEHEIALHEIKNFQIEKGDRILFKTKNSLHDWTSEPFRENYIYLNHSAAKYLQEKQVICIGVDYLSVGGKETGKEVHQILLGSEICIIEGLNLRNISSGIYEMICLPLKLKGADGAPARTIIRKLSS